MGLKIYGEGQNVLSGSGHDDGTVLETGWALSGSIGGTEHARFPVLSGSLTTLYDAAGSGFIRAGSNVTITSGSDGASGGYGDMAGEQYYITIASSGGGGSSAADDVSLGDAASTFATSDGDVLIEAQATDHKVTIKGDHESGVAIHLDGNAAAASEVQIDAGVLDVDVTAGITIDGTTVSIDGTDDSNLIVTGAGKDLTIAAGGGGAQVLQLASAGTGVDAIDILASAGSIDIDAADNITIDAADDISITSTSADGLITLHSAHTAGQAVFIDANADAGSILDIDAGILTVDVQAAATINAVGIALGAGSGELDLTTTGTLDVNANALDMDLTDSSAITITSSEGAEDLTIEQVGANDSSIIIQAEGTGTDAIKLNASAGSIDIDSADNITVDAADDITLTTTSADGLLKLHSAHTTGQAILIDANAHAGSILDIDAGILDVDVQGVASIDSGDTLSLGRANSGVAVSIGHATSETTVNDNLTVTGDLTVNGVTTTLDVTNLNVQDPFILLGDGAQAANSNAGIIFVSGSSEGSARPDVAFARVADDTWALGSIASLSGTITSATGMTMDTMMRATRFELGAAADWIGVDGGNVTITSDAAIVAAGSALLPTSRGGSTLGTFAVSWGDIYLADDKEIKFGTSASDVTIAHDNSNGLDITTDGDFDVVATVGDITLTTAGGTGEIIIHSGHTLGRAILIDANAHVGSILDIDAGIMDVDVQGVYTLDASGVSIDSDAASNLTTSSGALTITSAAAATWSTAAGVLTIDGDDGLVLKSTAAGITVDGSVLEPSANDRAALGDAGTGWSDLFLATGGEVDFGNGNVILSHSGSGDYGGAAGGLHVIVASGSSKTFVISGSNLGPGAFGGPSYNGYGTTQEFLSCNSNHSGDSLVLGGGQGFVYGIPVVIGDGEAKEGCKLSVSGSRGTITPMSGAAWHDHPTTQYGLHAVSVFHGHLMHSGSLFHNHTLHTDGPSIVTPSFDGYVKASLSEGAAPANVHATLLKFDKTDHVGVHVAYAVRRKTGSSGGAETGMIYMTSNGSAVSVSVVSNVSVDPGVTFSAAVSGDYYYLQYQLTDISGTQPAAMRFNVERIIAFGDGDF